jgi:hypothetical protein
MTQDEIIEMARQAGIIFGYPAYHDRIEAFAKLVAVNVKETLEEKEMNNIWKAIQMERESCAKLCEEEGKKRLAGYVTGEWCAKAIRTRGVPEFPWGKK